jgi:hypothetical protein
LEWNDAGDWEKYTQTDEFKALMGMRNLLTEDSREELHETGN